MSICPWPSVSNRPTHGGGFTHPAPSAPATAFFERKPDANKKRRPLAVRLVCRRGAPNCRRALARGQLTAMRLGITRSLFGSVIVSRPFVISALTLPVSMAASLTANVRL